MSTANKLTYLNVTKQKLKQAINNIGGEVTDETTFRQYVDQLDGVYDVLPKTEFQEGTEVTIENGLKGKLDFDEGKVGFGQASQESTNGYQLISLKDGTYTGNSGVTIKVENGKCTLNGTPSASEVIPVQLKDNLSLTNGQTYTLYGFNDVANSNVAFRPRIDEGFFQVAFDTTNKVESKTYNGTSISVAYIGIRVGSGTTITNLVCKPMLISGSDTTKTYEKYTGGYASPSPNWEQEVKCVAGRNKWNGEYTKNYIDANGDLVSSTNTLLTDYIELDSNITISAKENMYIVGVAYYNSSKTFISREQKSDRTFKNITYSAPINTKYVRIYVNLAITDFTDDDVKNFKIQIEQGSTSHPYLPYNTIEETIGGKNILPFKFNSNTLNGITLTANDDGTLKINGTSTANTTLGGTSLATYTLKKGTYTYSIENALISGANITIWYGTNSTIKSLGTTTSVNFEVAEDTTYQWFRLSLYIPSGQTYNNVILKPMIRKSSITDDTYEPYKTPKTYQFSLGNNKFYGIGTYRDYILRTTGKNLLNPSQYLHAVVNASVGGTGTLSEWATSWTTWIEMKPNQTYVFSGNLSNVNSNVARAFVTNSEVAIGTSVTRVNNLSNGGTYTNTGGYKYLVLEFLDVTAFEGNWQIEEGSTASDYQPYGVGNWYKVGKVAELSARNSTIIYDATLTNVSRFRIAISGAVGFVENGYCNYLKCENGFSLDEQHFYIFNGNLFFFIPNSIAQNLSQLETWLNSNDLKFYYPLVSSTYTPITGTLAEQLEEWWNGQSLDGTTIIEGNGDLPMIIKARALKGE